MSLKSPIISIDCKKKEKLSNLYRGGKCFATQTLNVYDHDYEHLSEDKVIPQGLFDMQAEQIHIGTLFLNTDCRCLLNKQGYQ